MTFDFLEAAEIEFREAFEYYEVQRPGLGEDFAREVYRTAQRILNHPFAWRKLSKRTRRCRTRRFPYGLIYQVREKEDRILIVPVMHLSRRLATGKGRLKGL
jgi:plasmid stabilization system protein ParE